MLLTLLPTTTERWLDLGIAAVIIVWGIYKKEVQEWARSFFTGLHQRFLLRGIVLRLTDKDVALIKKAYLGPLRSWLLVLSKEYRADRVTVTEFVKTDAGFLATCLAEVVELEMTSVVDDVQGKPMDEGMMSEWTRVHNLEGRYLYVEDARLLDNAELRDALLNSDVRSAYYQSLPTSTGKFYAILAISWRKDHPLSKDELKNLHLSGMGCGYVLQSQEPWKKTKKP